MTDHPRAFFDLGSSGLNPSGDTGTNFKLDDDGSGSPQYSHLTQLWATGVLDGKIEAQILVVGSYAYVVTRGGSFLKLNATTGALVLTYPIGSPSSSTPHIVSGIAYFGDDAGYFHAVDTSTMTVVWKKGPHTAGVPTHPIVVAGSGHVWYGTADGHAIGRDTSDGTQIADLTPSGASSVTSGALALYDGKILIAAASEITPDAGVYAIDDSTHAIVNQFGARGLPASVAWQASGWGQNLLCFEAADHWAYGYDIDTGDRVWHDRQTGDLQSPVGMDLSLDYADFAYVVIGTRNYSIQPHKAAGGKLQWKHDSFVASSAILAGFGIANGILGYVYPPSNGRLELTVLDGAIGGHGPDWKFGTTTGVQGGTDATNKGNKCCPTFVNGKVYWGADDKIARCFS